MLTFPGATPPPDPGRVARALAFARPYAAAAAGAAFMFTAGLASRRHRGWIVDLGARFGVRHGEGEAPTLPDVPLEAVAPDGTLIDIRAIAAVDGNVTEHELAALCRIARVAAPQRVFEFGTFDGRTTLNLAANAAPDARVFTLDLPRAALGATASAIDRGEVRFADKDAPGTRFRGDPLAARIVQLLGDSATFDYAPYERTMDLVFVDASHAHAYVVNDSLRAMRLLGPGGGTIVWHDYGRWAGVTRALHQLRAGDPRFASLRRIRDTTLAVLHVPPASRG